MFLLYVLIYTLTIFADPRLRLKVFQARFITLGVILPVKECTFEFPRFYL